MRIPACRSNRRILELFEPLDPMFAIGLDFPCKRILAVELEMCDRDDMHLLGVTTVVEMVRRS